MESTAKLDVFVPSHHIIIIAMFLYGRSIYSIYSLTFLVVC